MEDSEMHGAFLGYLYGKNYGDDDPTLDHVDVWVRSSRMDLVRFWKLYEVMIKHDYIKFAQDEGIVRITPKGTLFAEKSGLVNSKLIARNREARKKLMFAMAVCLTDTGPKAEISRLVKDAKLREGEIYGNLQLLVSMGYAKWDVLSERVSINPKVCAKASTVGRAA